MKKYIFIISIIASSFFCTAFASTVKFYDVGQGNLALIVGERKAVIVDAGSSAMDDKSMTKQQVARQVVSDINRLSLRSCGWTEKLSILISHNDADHYNMLNHIAEAILEDANNPNGEKQIKKVVIRSANYAKVKSKKATLETVDYKAKISNQIIQDLQTAGVSVRNQYLDLGKDAFLIGENEQIICFNPLQYVIDDKQKKMLGESNHESNDESLIVEYIVTDDNSSKKKRFIIPGDATMQTLLHYMHEELYNFIDMDNQYWQAYYNDHSDKKSQKQILINITNQLATVSSRVHSEEIMDYYSSIMEWWNAGSDIETVLLGSHHGSNEENSERFFKIFDPDWIVFSAPKYSSHKHPDNRTIHRAMDYLKQSNKTIPWHYLYLSWAIDSSEFQDFKKSNPKMYPIITYRKRDFVGSDIHSIFHTNLPLLHTGSQGHIKFTIDKINMDVTHEYEQKDSNVYQIKNNLTKQSFSIIKAAESVLSKRAFNEAFPEKTRSHQPLEKKRVAKAHKKSSEIDPMMFLKQ